MNHDSPWSQERRAGSARRGGAYDNRDLRLFDMNSRFMQPRPPARSDGQTLRGHRGSPRRQLTPLVAGPPPNRARSRLSQRPDAPPVGSDFDARGTAMLASLGEGSSVNDTNYTIPNDDPRLRLPVYRGTTSSHGSATSSHRHGIRRYRPDGLINAVGRHDDAATPEPASFDTDARNIGFLNSMLSIMPAHLQSVPEAISSPVTSVPININIEVNADGDAVPSLVSNTRVSPRSSKVYTRTETKVLERTLDQLMARSRYAVQNMRSALARQAVNGSRHTPSDDAPFRRRRQSSASHARTGTKDDGKKGNNRRCRNSTTRGQPQRNHHHPQRPRSASSITILETALAVSQESKAWDVVFAECVRQVHSKCKERGSLLNAIRVRNKQTCELLTNVVEAQQHMLNVFQKRQQHLRPRTRTVERKYRRKKAEMEVNGLTDRIRAHQVKLDHARARITQLGSQLGVGMDTDQEFEEELAEMNAEREYESSKIAFGTLLEDLRKIEAENTRFRCMISDSLTSVEGTAGAMAAEVTVAEVTLGVRALDDSVNCTPSTSSTAANDVGAESANSSSHPKTIDEDSAYHLIKQHPDSGSAVREALEMHREFVNDKRRRAEMLVEMATKLQAVFRASVARKTTIEQARIAYRQRQLLEEARLKEESKDKARLKVARWLQRLAAIELFKDRLQGFLGEEREKRKREILERRKRFRTMKIDRSKLTWKDYLRSAKIIQKKVRNYLWSIPQWRRRWMKNVKREAENALLDQVSDKEQAAQIRRTIALSLQEQEQVFFTRLHALRDRAAYLERKVDKAEKLSQTHAEFARTKVAAAEKNAVVLIRKTKEECDAKLRTMNYDLHKMQHEVENTKKKIVNRAKRRSILMRVRSSNETDAGGEEDEETAGHEYQIRMLVQAVHEMSMLAFPDLKDVMASVEAVGLTAEALSHSREDTGLGSESLDEHEEQLSEVAARSAASVSKTSLAMIQFQARLKDALKGITKRSEDVHDAFMEADHERKVLVKRIMDLEEELASYHPSHPDHYEETTHHSLGPDDDDGTAALPGAKSMGSSLRLPSNATGGVGLKTLLRRKKPARRHSAMEILKVAMQRKNPVGRQGRRPSTIRAHKSTGLFH
jgi:hypothetical protein